MRTITSKAAAVAQTAQDSFKLPYAAAFDPTAIAAVIGTIVEIIKLLQQCHSTPATALRTVQNPGMLNRIKLRRILRTRMTSQVSAAALSQAVTHIGATTSANDLVNMWREASAASPEMQERATKMILAQQGTSQ
jgi:hypothetical protein